MHNKLFKSGLLLFLLSFSFAFAEPQHNTFLDNTRISVDLGFGLPSAWGMTKETKDKIKVDNKPIDLDVKPNISLGILMYYGFNLNEHITIGPEIGINYGFTRKLQIKNFGITLAEKYLQFPLYLKISAPSSDESPVGGSFLVGYDLNICMSSDYKQSGYYPEIDSSFHGDKNLKEFIKDFSRMSGSIVLGGGYEFPKGIYLIGKFKLPIEIFKVIKSNNESSSNKGELNSKFLDAARGLSASLIEFSLGVDVMKLIQ